MDLSLFSSPSYWFSSSPGSEFGFLYELLVFCTALLVLAIALSIFLHFKHIPKVLRTYILKVKRHSYTFAWVGYLLIFFRYENAYLLSMRFFWMIYIILFLIFIIQTFINLAIHYPADTRKLAAAEKSKRYKLGKK